MDDGDKPTTSPPSTGSPSNEGIASPKPLTMQLFASWVKSDFRKLRTPYFVPRLCQLNITRLEFIRAVPQPIDFVVLIVRMQGGLIFHRSLRSDKIFKPEGQQLLDSFLDLSFAIQYSHNIQHENNLLQIMVARRKKRTRKLQTVCSTVVRMEEVVQNIIHRKLIMYGPSVKGNLSPVCKVEVAINSTSLADEFEKHFQDESMDFREELNFLSDEVDEEEYLEDSFHSNDKKENSRADLNKSPKQGNKIKSKMKSLLRLPRRNPKSHDTSNLNSGSSPSINGQSISAEKSPNEFENEPDLEENEPDLEEENDLEENDLEENYLGDFGSQGSDFDAESDGYSPSSGSDLELEDSIPIDRLIRKQLIESDENVL